MAQEDRNRLAEWVVLIREQGPVLRHQVGVWIAAVREEPAMIWNSQIVRIAAYALGGLVLIWIIHWAVNLAVPPKPASARPEATTADFHVICTHRDCGDHFVIRREFGFDDFPVLCLRCNQKTGQRAVSCNSEACRGRWVVPAGDPKSLRCPYCGGRFP